MGYLRIPCHLLLIRFIGSSATIPFTGLFSPGRGSYGANATFRVATKEGGGMGRQRDSHITDYYRHKAARLARGSAPYQQPIIDSFLRELRAKEDLSGWVCLDFGCGVGKNHATLGKHVRRLTAVDVSMDGLREAKGNAPSGIPSLFSCYDGYSLPFPDSVFDLVVCTEVLEHVADPRQAMNEICRVLAPGGYLITSVPNYFNLAGLIKLIMDARVGTPQWEPWGSHPGGFERFTTSFWLERAVKSGNIAVLRARGVNMTMAWDGLARIPLGQRALRRLDRYSVSWRFCMNYFLLGRSLKK